MFNERTDITMHGDSELVDIIINDEYLYNLMDNVDLLIETVNETYLYVEEQLEELMEYVGDYME